MGDQPRPRRILTPTDREFLRTVPNYYDGENARQSRYQRRRDIRERIVGAILDFQELRYHLDESERRKIFADPEANGAESPLEFSAALESLLWWVYIGCRDSDLVFDSLLETPVRRAEEDYHRMHSDILVDVKTQFNVEVTQRYEGIDEFARRLEEGRAVRATNFYRIPTFSDFAVDTEKIDIVRFVPSGTNHDREREVIATILREYLGIEPEIEHGIATLSLTDYDFLDDNVEYLLRDDVEPDDVAAPGSDPDDSEPEDLATDESPTPDIDSILFPEDEAENADSDESENDQ